MEVTRLKSFIDSGEEEGRIEEYLSSFSCDKNEDVQFFLHQKAINSEKRNICRTFIIHDEKNNDEIIGYFTLMVKEFQFIGVSKNKIEILTKDRSSTSFHTILIAQLGRSDKYKNIVDGKEILAIALDYCKEVFELTAMKVVCVEYEPNEFLHNFYSDNGFTLLQTNTTGYNLAFMKII